MNITLVQEYTIQVPDEYKKLPFKDLVNALNAMYDINGKHIIETLSAEEEYLSTTLTEVNGVEVYIEGVIIGDEGHSIILDGQPLDGQPLDET